MKLKRFLEKNIMKPMPYTYVTIRVLTRKHHPELRNHFVVYDPKRNLHIYLLFVAAHKNNITLKYAYDADNDITKLNIETMKWLLRQRVRITKLAPQPNEFGIFEADIDVKAK